MYTRAIDHEAYALVHGIITIYDPGGLDGSAAFTITVRDRNEPETLTLSTNSPRVDTAVTGRLSGGDDITSGPTWRWKRSGSSTTIATGYSYTPTTSDIGSTLTLTASYSDTHGSKSLSKTTRAVTGPQVNRPPSFSNPASTATLAENAGIGTRVVTLRATDPDNDTLTFSIDNSYFNHRKSGNSVIISSATRLNHESISSTTLWVTVTDEDGLSARTYLTVTIRDLNEPETFNLTWSGSRPAVGSQMTSSITPADDLVGSRTWTWQYARYSRGPWTNISSSNSTYFTPDSSHAEKYIRARIKYSDTHGSKTGYTRTSPKVEDNTPTNQRPYFTNSPYNFSVNENTAADTTVGTAITIKDPEGDATSFQLHNHSSRFKISPTSGKTTYIKTTSTPINFETTSSYRLRVRVSESQSSCCLDGYVNVTIQNVDEAESVSLTLAAASKPTIGTSITASITGGDQTSSPRWQWQSSSNQTGPTWTDISGATSKRYTPTDSLFGKHLRATVSYTDGPFGTDSANSSGTLAVQQDIYNPTLKSLTVSPVDVHAFLGSVRKYHVGISSSTSSATITLEPTTSTATVTVKRSGTSGNISATSTSGSIKTYTVSDLDPGLTTFTIKVSTGRKNATYTIALGRAVNTTFGWRADEDFNKFRRSSDDHDQPISITSDGTTMWLAYSGSNILYAYSLSTTGRTSSDDVTLPAGTAPTAIWYHNNLIYVAKNSAATLKAFNTSGTEDTTKSITLNSRNTRPTAIWSNDTTIWVADSSRRRLYAYSLSTRRADTTKDFNNINSYPAGLHSNGYTMWISDRQNRRIYAYDFNTKKRLSTNDFTTLTAAGNRTPTGIWGTNTDLWVADRTNHKLYAYNPPRLSNDTDINSLTLDGVEYVTTGPQTSNIIDNAVTRLIIKLSLAHPDATHRIAVVSSSTAKFSSGTEVTYKTSIKGYQVPLQQRFDPPQGQGHSPGRHHHGRALLRP